MNRLTLHFQDRLQEREFQEYQSNNYRLYLIQTFAIGFFILLAQAIIVLVDGYYLFAGFCSLLTLICLYMLVQLSRSKLLLKYAYRFHNIMVCLYPEITLYQCIFLDMTIQATFTQVLISQIIIQSAIIQQNIILGSFQFINSLFAHLFVIYWKFGFCYQQSIMILYYLYWALQEYQRISINRSNFIATQVNHSIYEIFRNITTFPMVIFNYDQEHLIFRTEQKFNVQKQEFNIQSSLSRIYINNKTNLSEYIYQNFIKKSVQGFQKYTINGLLKNTKQRIQLELYVQTYPKTKFILKLLEPLKLTCPNELKYLILKLQQALSIRLNLNHLMISYKYGKHQVSKSLIKIQQFVKSVAHELQLKIEFLESPIQDLQLMLDTILIYTLFQSILYLMNTKSNIVKFSINQDEAVYQLMFHSQNKINVSLPGYLKTRFFNNLNYLAHQLSFSDLLIKEKVIILDIMKLSMSDVFI